MKKILLSLAIIISNLFFAQEMINYKNQGNKIEFKISSEEFYGKFLESNESAIKLKQKDNFKKLSNTSALMSFDKRRKNYLGINKF